MLYVKTSVHEKSVVLRIEDEQNIIKSFFLPEKLAKVVRNNFEEPSEMNLSDLFLKFNGYGDEQKKLLPALDFVYDGNAQHE